MFFKLCFYNIAMIQKIALPNSLFINFNFLVFLDVLGLISKMYSPKLACYH